MENYQRLKPVPNAIAIHTIWCSTILLFAPVGKMPRTLSNYRTFRISYTDWPFGGLVATFRDDELKLVPDKFSTT